MKQQLMAGAGNWLTQKQLSAGEQRIFATHVSGDVRAEDWIEITAEEKAELEKEK